MNESIEKSDDADLERDPYINLNIKKERMKFDKPNLYRPLSSFLGTQKVWKSLINPLEKYNRSKKLKK